MQAQGELTQLREQLVAMRTRLGETEQERDEATKRTEVASAARAEAEERARGAVARADDEAARAQRAESDLAKVRDQLDLHRTERDAMQEEVSSLRGSLTAVSVERDSARTDIERERTHGGQRVSDLRITQEQQLAQARDELAELRKEAREQRSRADRAETRPAAQTANEGTKPKSTKQAPLNAQDHVPLPSDVGLFIGGKLV